MKSTNVTSATKGTASIIAYLASGDSFTITEDDLVSGSLTLKSGTSESGEITVGAAIISECDFTLLNDTGKFSGINWFDAYIVVVYVVGNVHMNMGTYYVAKHTEQGLTISFECYDCLEVLDNYQLYENDITYPCDAADVIDTIANNHGFIISGTVTGIEVQDPGDDKLTERAVFSYLAQMMGKFVRSRDTDTIKFDWYDTSTTYDAGTTFSHDLQTADITVTGVKVTSYDETTVEERGTTTGEVIDISDNPFITADNISTVADTIYAAVNGLSFRPGSVQIASNPAIEAGDMLLINTGQETGIKILASTVTYKTSAVKQSITSDAPEYSGDLRISQSAYIKKQMQDTISEELADDGSELSTAIANSGGSSGSSDSGGSNQAIWIPATTITKSLECPYVNILTGEWSSTTLASFDILEQLISVPSRDASYEAINNYSISATPYFYTTFRCGFTGSEAIAIPTSSGGTYTTQPVIYGFIMARCYWAKSSNMLYVEPWLNANGVMFGQSSYYPYLRFFPIGSIGTFYLTVKNSGWYWLS